MDPNRRPLMEQRRKDYFSTRRQRRAIRQLLREGYDDASHNSRDKPFSVSLHMSDIPDLTDQNQGYLETGQASDDLKKLFGIIAARAEFSIDNVDDEYIISLSNNIESTNK